MRLREKFSRVSFIDVMHLFKFILAFPVSFILRRRRGNIWLIAEYENEARDNAYWLFRYIRENYPCEDVVYAINNRAFDFKNVESLGEVVNYGSLKHWIYYLAAKVNISSQKGGKPNAALCYVLEVSGLLKNTRVFLQHGVILNDTKYLYYKDTKISLFICGARPEYHFVKKSFGYPLKNVVCAGMCRFDSLVNSRSRNKTILVMPTWRKWIAHGVCASEEGYFRETDYFKNWSQFLFSTGLHKMLDEFGLTLVFCPHRNMEYFLKYFSCNSQRVIILPWSKADIYKNITNSPLLVTDYSSVSVDFAYMGKNLIYYQFDVEQFRKYHLSQSYFDYARDGFGPVCHTLTELLSSIHGYVLRGFKADVLYDRRADNFFAFRDNRNCERNYIAIKKLTSGEKLV